MIKGLGERQTFFVELAVKDDESRAQSPSIRTAAEDSAEINLVKMPALTRNKKPSPSPFSEDEKKGSGLHSPAVVDMVKPQAPLEEAWRPSPTSSDSVELQATSRGSTRVTPATESADHDKGSPSPHKTNPSLFIAPGSNPVPEREQRTSRGKCVLC